MEHSIRDKILCTFHSRFLLYMINPSLFLFPGQAELKNEEFRHVT